MHRTPRDGEIDIMRWKRDPGIQYRHEKKEDVIGSIPKPIARQNTEQCTSTKVCYCKIDITDINT